MKANKKTSLLRRKENQPKPRPAKGQDGRKVHDTKGKNTHGRRYQ